MRPALLNAYWAMLSRLQAEEALSSISQMSAAFGTMSKHDRASYIADLKSNLPRQKPQRPSSHAQLARMGMKVVVEDA